MFRQLSRQTVKTLPRSWFVYSRPVHNTPVPQPVPSNTEQPKRDRKPKWTTSYSSMSLEDVEDRLGLRIATLELQAISVAKMLAEAKYKQDAGDAILNNTRERVYDRILDHLVAEGYPSESDPYFKEVNTSDLVYATIVPIIVDFSINRRNTLQLQRERQIISTDSVTGGYEEFVVVDWISMREAKFVFVIEAKRSSLGQAVRQCLLSMKDARDSNGGGMVYGFTTTGELWRMVTYDGELFKMTEQFFALFPGMRVEKERWMKDYSVLVDCMYVALSNGGID